MAVNVHLIRVPSHAKFARANLVYCCSAFLVGVVSFTPL